MSRPVAGGVVGHRALVQRRQNLAPRRIVLEANGGYETVITAALGVAELPMVVANLRHVRGFGRATGRLAKSDALDAALLARSAESIQPDLRPLLDAAEQALKALVGRRRDLVPMQAMEKQRAHHASDPERASLARYLA